MISIKDLIFFILEEVKAKNEACFTYYFVFSLKILSTLLLLLAYCPENYIRLCTYFKISVLKYVLRDL